LRLVWAVSILECFALRISLGMVSLLPLSETPRRLQIVAVWSLNKDEAHISNRAVPPQSAAVSFPSRTAGVCLARGSGPEQSPCSSAWGGVQLAVGVFGNDYVTTAVSRCQLF
jgi:hypothetical protein